MRPLHTVQVRGSSTTGRSLSTTGGSTTKHHWEVACGMRPLVACEPRRSRAIIGSNAACRPDRTATPPPRSLRARVWFQGIMQVVLRFRPQDLKDAGVNHIPLEGYSDIERGIQRTEHVSLPEHSTLEMVLWLPDKTVAAFIGGCLSRDGFIIEGNTRPNLREGAKDWERECWHWVVTNQGLELDRTNNHISQMPMEEYCLQDGTVVLARVAVLERLCCAVHQFTDGEVTYTVQYKK